jgi:mono/diheme cytochrome c family protein
MKTRINFPRAVAALLVATGCASCDNMKHQENVRAFAPSAHFADGASARLPPAHTVARGAPAWDDPVATRQKNGALLTEIPLPLTRALLERGRDRFNIYCAACHGEDGFGRSIVVGRGFPAPPSYQETWLIRAPAGHFFEVITHGIGRMYPLADRIEPRDRWAIVAYVRALQRSQHATLDDVPSAERQHLSTP